MGVEETGEKTPVAKLDKARRASDASRVPPWSGDNRISGKQRNCVCHWDRAMSTERWRSSERTCWWQIPKEQSTEKKDRDTEDSQYGPSMCLLRVQEVESQCGLGGGESWGTPKAWVSGSLQF